MRIPFFHVKIFNTGFPLKMIPATKLMKNHNKNIWIVWEWHKVRDFGRKTMKDI